MNVVFMLVGIFVVAGLVVTGITSLIKEKEKDSE